MVHLPRVVCAAAGGGEVTLSKRSIEELLGRYPQYRRMLFQRGYLISTRSLARYPFYSNWRKSAINVSDKPLYVYTHIDPPIAVETLDDVTGVLVGHGYNPITMQYRESDILRVLLSRYRQSRESFFEALSEITGIHVIVIADGAHCLTVQDCCGIMPVYYGRIGQDIYLTSHCQLVADICGLERTTEIERYLRAPFYRIGISQLCGVDSPFSELTMLSPNTYLTVPNLTVHRFYPVDPLPRLDGETLEWLADTLRYSIELCTRKWKCSVSLSGGVDSRLTLAAANGHYDRLGFFSFASTPAESRDAHSAAGLCSVLGLQHDLYVIPDDESAIRDFDVISQIMEHNTAYIKPRRGADARKRAYFTQFVDMEIEIKSHVSEVARAFYYKKLGKVRFRTPLTARHMSNLAKRNLLHRSILKDMDRSFQRFIDISSFGSFPDGYDETDLFYWENRMPAWAALVKQSFDTSHDTTMIYNNRRLLEAFLSFPLADRITDRPQRELIRMLNPALACQTFTENAMKRRWRIIAERLFFEVNSRIP